MGGKPYDAIVSFFEASVAKSIFLNISHTGGLYLFLVSTIFWFDFRVGQKSQTHDGWMHGPSWRRMAEET